MWFSAEVKILPTEPSVKVDDSQMKQMISCIGIAPFAT